MSSASDFVIENGVLTKYDGPGGNVTVPKDVMSIEFRLQREAKTLPRKEQYTCYFRGQVHRAV